jgi:SnoaL-like domain
LWLTSGNFFAIFDRIEAKYMTESERLARAAIEKTLGVCTQAGDARKAEPYSKCFMLDGILDLGEPRLEGRDAIRRWMESPSPIPQPRGRAPGYVSHHLTTCRIELTSATSASVRTYWLVTTAIGLDHNGYYDDVFSQIGDEWLIASRRPRTLWKSADSLLR